MDEQVFGVKTHNQGNKLLQVYADAFKQRFGEAPITNSDDGEILRNLIDRLGYDKVKTLLIKYLQIQDDWISGQGFSLQWFKSNLNRVITMTDTGNGKKTGPVYVVNITDKGVPVCSYDPSAMKGQSVFLPQTWDDWVKGNIEEKLALATKSDKSNFERWFEVGNDVNMWVKLWHSNGWLQKEVKEIKPPSVI